MECEPGEKKTCLFCHSIRTTKTFATKACEETFKNQDGPLNSSAEKVLNSVRCKSVMKILVLKKSKLSFDIDSVTIKH